MDGFSPAFTKKMKLTSKKEELHSFTSYGPVTGQGNKKIKYIIFNLPPPKYKNHKSSKIQVKSLKSTTD